MTDRSNGSTPRSPRPVAAVRRHAAVIAASGALLVGLLVLTGIAFDGSRAEGQDQTSTAAPAPVVNIADLSDSAVPVHTDVMGERAQELFATFDRLWSEKQDADARAARGSGSGRAANVVNPADPTVWDQLAFCETRNNWATDSVPGFAGGLGFANGTWTSYGGGEFAQSAADATREQQIEIAIRVQASQGWGAWPGCSALLGLR